ELLDTDHAVEHWKAHGMDLAPVFEVPETRYGGARRRVRAQDHGLDEALDRTLIQLAEAALEDAHPLTLDLPIRHVNRTVGAQLPTPARPRRPRAAAAPPRPAAGAGGSGPTPPTSPGPARRVSPWVLPCPPASRWPSSATRTTPSARACRAGGSSCARTRTRR